MSTKFNLTDSALDAGIAAWFGVAKVEAEKNFIRTRMRAAVLAVLANCTLRATADVITAIIRDVSELEPADASALDTLMVSVDALRAILEQQLDASAHEAAIVAVALTGPEAR